MQIQFKETFLQDISVIQDHLLQKLKIKIPNLILLLTVLQSP